MIDKLFRVVAAVFMGLLYGSGIYILTVFVFQILNFVTGETLPFRMGWAQDFNWSIYWILAVICLFWSAIYQIVDYQAKEGDRDE